MFQTYQLHFYLLVVASLLVVFEGKATAGSEGPKDEPQLDRVARQANGGIPTDPTASRTDSSTGSAFDFVYDYLQENNETKMCSLLREAEVDSLLQQVGEFTLFVPTDEAFALVPGSALDELRNNPTKRRDFVLRHIVPGKYLLQGLSLFEESTVTTLQGSTLHVSAYEKGFVVSGANVLDGDKAIGKKNGTIVHFIDKILFPAPEVDLLSLIKKRYNQMSQFLATSDLQAQLSAPRTAYTFFVPTDEAFRAVPWEVTTQMLTNNTFLRTVIENHIIPGTIYSTGLPGIRVYSVAGELLTFETRPVQSRALVMINSAVPIIEPDQVVTNGVVHGISRLLLPPNLLEDCNCKLQSTTASPGGESTLQPVYVPTSLSGGPLEGDSTTPSTPTNEIDLINKPFRGDFFRRAPSQEANQDTSGQNGPEMQSNPPYSSNISTGLIQPTLSLTPQVVWGSWDAIESGPPPPQLSTDRPFASTTRPPFFRQDLRNRQPVGVNQDNKDRPQSPSVKPESESQVKSEDTPQKTAPDSPHRRQFFRPLPTQSNDDGQTTPRPAYTRYDPTRRPPTKVKGTPGLVHEVNQPQGDNTTPAPASSRPFFRAAARPILAPSTQRPYFQSSPPPYRPQNYQGEPLTSTFSPTQGTTRGQYFRRPLPSRAQYQPVTGQQKQDFEPQRYETPLEPHDQQRVEQEPQQPVQQQSEEPANYFQERNVDRRGDSLRREPLGPSPYRPTVRPTPGAVQAIAGQSENNEPGNNRAQRPSSQSDGSLQFRPTVSSTPFYRFEDGTISTNFFDPTRKPKTSPKEAPRPFFRPTPQNVNPGGQSVPIQSYEYATPTTVGLPTTVMGQRDYPRPQYPQFRQTSSIRPAPEPKSQHSSGPSTEPDKQQQSQEQQQQLTILDVLEEPGLEIDGKPAQFSIMKESLYQAGLLQLMSQPGPITLFLPTDDAFRSLPQPSVTRLQNSPNDLRSLLLRHIVNFEVPAKSLKDNSALPSYSGESLIINVILDGKVMLVRGTPIVAATSARNGQIYVINKVLDGEPSSANLLQELKKRPDLSLFYNYLQRTQLAQKLEGQGPFTIIAPNNKAFEDLSPVTRQVIEYNPSALEKLLKSHIFDGAIYRKQLELMKTLPSGDTSNGQPLKLSLSSGVLHINEGPSLSEEEIGAANGVIHPSNQVIIPENGIFKQLQATASLNPKPYAPRFGFKNYPRTSTATPTIQSSSRTDDLKGTRFYQWLQKTGIIDQLANSGSEFTIILPTDEAVDKLPLKLQQTLEANPRQVQSLLRYHVVPGITDVSKLKDEDTLPSINGKDIRFNRYNNESVLALSGAPIEDEAREGKLLFIIVDRVLYPPRGTLFEVISKSPVLKSLTKLVKVANLDIELSNSGPFTLFAPTDDAFKKLSPETIKHLSQDSQSSRAFLLRHIVRPLLFTSAIPMGRDNATTVENATGESLTLQRNPDCVSVDGITLSYADITATNGVVHVIDHVL